MQHSSVDKRFVTNDCGHVRAI